MAVAISQPEALIAAIENMLPDGKRGKSFFYLSIDFIRDMAFRPSRDSPAEYSRPVSGGKRLCNSWQRESNLMPKGDYRAHALCRWLGAITTGRTPMTLFDLLGYEVKANPKYGSEKKGQPTTYYLSAAPETIRMNCEYPFC